jgi:hypothetical protein
MLSFKEYLKEAELTRDEVLQWAHENDNKFPQSIITDVNVGKEPPFLISVHTVNFNNLKIFKKPLPVQFGYIKFYLANECEYLTDLSQLRVQTADSLQINGTAITSFKNCPEIFALRAQKLRKLTTLEGISKEVNKVELIGAENLTSINAEMPNVTSFLAPVCGITSLKDIHKYLPKLEVLQINSNPIVASILGLLKLQNLRMMIFENSPNSPAPNDFIAAMRIVNEFVMAKNYNISECQTRLFKAGLKDFAKL